MRRWWSCWEQMLVCGMSMPCAVLVKISSFEKFVCLCMNSVCGCCTLVQSQIKSDSRQGANLPSFLCPFSWNQTTGEKSPKGQEICHVNSGEYVLLITQTFINITDTVHVCICSTKAIRILAACHTSITGRMHIDLQRQFKVLNYMCL